MRVSIVGAGIIGLSLAWELARRGANVSVFERGQAGRETSWAAAGILPAVHREMAADPLERLRGLSHELYPRWVDALTSATGIDSGLRRSGGLYLASSVGEAASLLANLDYQRDLKIETKLLTREELAADEPLLSPWAMSSRFRAAVLSTDEWQIRPPDHLAALLTACRSAGVFIQENVRAELLVESRKAALRLDQGNATLSVESADYVVVCSGAWTGRFAADLGLAQSVVPIRGQMLMFRFPDPPLKRIVNEGHRYLVPRDDGRLLVGSCEEEVGFQSGTTSEMLDPLVQWAETILPSLIGMRPERTWSALRPGTFDGFPMIGRVPDISNLYVASGHYRSGIHLAPATACVVADMLCGKTPAVDTTSFGVGRLIHNDRHTTEQTNEHK